MKVRCDICLETIAETSPEALSKPLRGEMFTSPDPDHSYPDPFASWLTWEDMRCPYSPPPGHRPFISENEITVLQDGKWVKFKVPDKVPEKEPEIESQLPPPGVPKRGRPPKAKKPLDVILED